VDGVGDPADTLTATPHIKMKGRAKRPAFFIFTAYNFQVERTRISRGKVFRREGLSGWHVTRPQYYHACKSGR
jgi:hypothetical protein